MQSDRVLDSHISTYIHDTDVYSTVTHMIRNDCSLLLASIVASILHQLA